MAIRYIIGSTDPRSWEVGDRIMVGGFFEPIDSLYTYLPNCHPGSPIAPDMVAVEAITARGSVWHGYKPDPTRRLPDPMPESFTVETTVAMVKAAAARAQAFEDLINEVWRCERWADWEAEIDTKVALVR